MIDGNTAQLFDETSNWILLIVYRGLHCPICKDCATRFEHNPSKLQDMNTQLFFISADPSEKAKTIA
ncbi:MAG: redoxin domain-containing protein [Thalassobaculaceae bacterium]